MRRDRHSYKQEVLAQRPNAKVRRIQRGQGKSVYGTVGFYAYEVVIDGQAIAPWELSAAAAWRTAAGWIDNGWDKRNH